jgi:hypothetical protein
MPFQLPETFQKVITPATQKVYKGKLNALAKHGFDTVDALKTKKKEVIAAIKKISGESDDEKARNLRRYFLSAISWVVKLPAKNPYRTYYQKCLPLKVLGTDKDWVKRSEYTPTATTKTSDSE